MTLFRRARCAAARTLAACLMLLALAGCGPGVMGTGGGTGDHGPQGIQYTPLALCKADFAGAALRCSTVSPDPWGGTSTVQWSDADKSHDASAVAVLEGNSLSLQVPCRQTAFLGNWGELQDGTLAFVGRFMGPGAGEGGPAFVRYLPAPEEPTAVGWLQLEDAAGSVLSGPWLMRRIDGEATVAACSP